MNKIVIGLCGAGAVGGGIKTWCIMHLGVCEILNRCNYRLNGLDVVIKTVFLYFYDYSLHRYAWEILNVREISQFLQIAN